MRRHIPGLNLGQIDSGTRLDGLFLVRVDRAIYLWKARKSSLVVRFVVLEPLPFALVSFSAHLYCSERALWKLNWFLRDFGYDPELLDRDQIDEKALLNLRGVVRTSVTKLNGHSYQNLDSFAPVAEWVALFNAQRIEIAGHGNQNDL
jgi:hypothetical protein